jgi:hypothetical protein
MITAHTTKGPTMPRSNLAVIALPIVGEAAVHGQQYPSIVHGVRWIGPSLLAHLMAVVRLVYQSTHVDNGLRPRVTGPVAPFAPYGP